MRPVTATSQTRHPRPSRFPTPTHLALLALVVAALAVRFIGLNWDDGQLLHPDEYHVTEVTVDRVQLPRPVDWSNLADPAVSTLNPRSDNVDGDHRSFAYGSLPLYATDLAAEALNRLDDLSGVSAVVPGPADRDWHSLDQLFKVGRAVNMLLDTLVVLIVFAVARQVGGSVAGLFAGATYAFAPMVIQLAHFYTTDSWLTFGAALTLLCAVRAARDGGRWRFIALGLAAGLTLATKPTGAATLALLAVAIVYDAWLRHRSGHTATVVAGAVAERLVLAAAAALLVFAIGEPYALLDPSSYLADLREQTGIQRGTFDVPYTRVYVGTIPVLYQVEQLVRWGMGPVGGVLGIVGTVALAVRAWRHRGAAELMTLAWILIFLATLLLPQSKFLRYVAPMVPALAIAGGYLISRLVRLRLRLPARVSRPALAGAVMAGLVFWVSATSSVYAHDNTRIEASRWIYANVPAGSSLSTEVWDRGVPLDLGPVLRAETYQYQWVSFDSYADRPTSRDLVAVADVLATQPAAAPAASAIRGGDTAGASDALTAAADTLAAMPADDGEALSSRLRQTSAGFSATSNDLHYALDVLSDALLSSDPVAIADAWRGLATEVVSTGSEEIATALYTQLEQIDYYVISSNRISASVTRLPWRYPTQIAFLDAMQRGELGFTPVAEFTSHPAFAGIGLVDDDADESWINYDHPRVLIYQKTALPTREQFDAVLAEALLQPVSPTRAPPTSELLLDEPNGDLPVVADARWSAGLTDNPSAALAVWVILLVVLQVAGLPLARVLLGRLAEGGWVFARLLMMLTAAFVVWLGASTGLFLFRAVWCGLAVLVVAGLFWALRVRWRSGAALFRTSADQRRIAGIGEIVFWTVFAFFLVLRFYNPDSWHPAWGGEKPMEFAHLNATLRSAEFPPYDPWYSGGYLNYYYYGLYVVAFLVKLTGIPAEIAFNLAQPTVMALLATGAFGVAATLGRDLTRRFGRPRLLPIAGGLMGAVLMVAVGNLGGFVDRIQFPDLDSWGVVWYPSRALDPLDQTTITEFPYFTGLYADLHAHAIALPITVLVIALGYSLASQPRLLNLALSTGRVGRFRAELGGRLVALALTLATLYMTNAWDIATYVLFSAACLFLATRALPTLIARLVGTAALLGIVGVLTIAFILPFYLTFVALFSSVGRVADPTPFWRELVHFGGLMAIVTVGLIAYLSAHARGGWRVWLQPLVPVVAMAVVLAAAAALSRSTEADRPIQDLPVIGLVAVIAILVGAAAWSRLGTTPGDDLAASFARMLVAGAVVVGIGAAAIGQPVFGLGVVLAGVGASAWLALPGTGIRMVGLLVTAAAGVVAALEVVYLADNLAGGSAYRMNTVFKFYNQAWVLFVLSGAGLVAWMVGRTLPLVPPGPDPARYRSGHRGGTPLVTPPEPVTPGPRMAVPAVGSPSRGWARVGLIVTALVVGLSAVYPVTATPNRLATRFDGVPNTLDAYAWMDDAIVNRQLGPCQGATDDDLGMSFADDRAAIDWFNREVGGSPVIVEWTDPQPYWCYPARFSVTTGLPTILGWSNHESQQRPADDFGQRYDDIITIYDATDPKEKLATLRAYGVEYVIVGTLERQLLDQRGRPALDPDGLAVFDDMVGTSLDIAFQRGGTTVYRVLPATGTPVVDAPPVATPAT